MSVIAYSPARRSVSIAGAGVADKIDLRLAPALETLAGLGPDRSFDFAFVDAVKTLSRLHKARGPKRTP